MDSLPEYEALSYSWGYPTHNDEIEIDGQHFPVTENLRLALQHLRRKNEARILWVDAICINQMDMYEKVGTGWEDGQNLPPSKQHMHLAWRVK
jgi:hypothetical protein